MPSGWDALAVDAQEGSGESMLAHFRRALSLRHSLAGRVSDRTEWRPSPRGVLVYQREHIAVACNFRSAPITLPVHGKVMVASDPCAHARGGKVSLPPNSAAWLIASPR